MKITTQAPPFVQAPKIPIQAVVVAQPKIEPEHRLWKISAETISPQSALIERVIFVVFALLASAVVVVE
jgi:hypothetical protein